jgi:hypothetical protein
MTFLTLFIPCIGFKTTAQVTPKNTSFLTSNFRRVVNVVCILLGNSPASEVYMASIQSTLSVPSSWGCRCTYQPMKIEQPECSEMSAYKIQTPGNYPEESIQQIHHSIVYAYYLLLNPYMFRRYYPAIFRKLTPKFLQTVQSTFTAVCFREMFMSAP